LIRTLFDAESVPASVLYKEARLQNPLTITGFDNETALNMAVMAAINTDLFNFAGKYLPENEDDCARNATADLPCREW